MLVADIVQFKKLDKTCKLILLALGCRDPAAEEKMNPFAEQEAWEEHQIGNS